MPRNVDVREVVPPRDVLISVWSGVWTAALHYWIRVEREWFGYVVWAEPRDRRGVRRRRILPVREIRPLVPADVHVRLHLGWAKGRVTAWRQPRNAGWSGLVTIYAGRRDTVFGSQWVTADRIHTGPLPPGSAAWEPPRG